MARVLCITANPKSKDESNSLQVAGEFIDAYRRKNPVDEVVELDLYKTDLPLVNATVLSGWGKLQKGENFENLAPDERDLVGRIDGMTNQFIAGDKYVFVTPLWNLSVPPKMKAYIDTICVVGKTFKYTEEGPVGLLRGKRAIHIQSRGGVYSEGPAKDLEFGDRYMRAILSFLGITMVDSIIVEGIDWMPEKAEGIRAAAIEKARQAAQSF